MKMHRGVSDEGLRRVALSLTDEPAYIPDIQPDTREEDFSDIQEGLERYEEYLRASLAAIQTIDFEAIEGAANGSNPRTLTEAIRALRESSEGMQGLLHNIDVFGA